MKKLLLLCVAIFCLTAAGCGFFETPDYTPDPEDVIGTPGATVKPPESTPVEGGTLKCAVAVYNTLNPLSTNSEDIKYYMSLVFEPMLNLDIEQKLVPCLCESWECSEDGLKWTFHMRSGINWQDGQPLSCGDFKSTVDWIKNNGGIYKTNVQNIVSCNVLSDSEFEINLKVRDGFLPNKMIFPILRNGQELTTGTGMYSLESDSESSIVLSKNLNWWGTEKPHIDRIEISKMSNEDEKCAASSDLTFLFDNYVQKYSFKDGCKLYTNQGRIFTMMAVNNANIPDANLRIALCYIIDKVNVLNSSVSGRGLSTDWPVYPGTVYWRDGSVYYLKNTKLAEDHMNAAGYTKNADGWYKDGVGPLIFTLTCPNTVELAACADSIKKQFENFGIGLNVAVESSLQSADSKYRSGQYTLGLMQLNLSTWPDIQDIVTSGGSLNFFKYSDQTVDSLLADIDSLDTASQCDRMSQVQTKLNEDEPFIGLYIRGDAISVSSSLVGPGNTGVTVWNPFWAFSRWYIKG
ncbi:MAG: ABC transporter substrate-binding protein [Clostridiales bacterium]|nr:ABC transporter substrate-binding protein [Clostridiales bacterium]